MPGKKLSQKDLDQFDGMLRHMLGVISGDLRVLESEAMQDWLAAAECEVEVIDADEKGR